MRFITKLTVLNGYIIWILGFLIAITGQQNTAAAITNSLTGAKGVPVVGTNNTLVSSSPSSSDEETNVNPSASSTAQANNTLLTTARLSTAMSHSSNTCDQSIWYHIYHPFRLQVNDPCITVTGIIKSIKQEPDGDLHVRVQLDPEFTNLLNNRNVAGQFGNLVVEPVCQGPVTQPDAVAACQNFHQDINVPPVGTHVTLTGAYVLDLQHGWMEIHPVTSITSS